jgi:hypothetical protein
MAELRFYGSLYDTLLYIIPYPPTQTLVCLCQASRRSRDKISDDKRLWRSIYEYDIGSDFAKDLQALWAVRRLWSRSNSEDKRCAALNVNLLTVENPKDDAWFHLVCGRMSTMKNWRNIPPQHIITFYEGQHNISDVQVSKSVDVRHGTPFISAEDRPVFGIIDDSLNDTRSTSMLEEQTRNALSIQADNNTETFFGKALCIYSTQRTNRHPDYPNHSFNEEFVVIGKNVVIDKQDDRNLMVMLVWDIGRLCVHSLEHQSYYIPSLCMAELMPYS